MALLFFDSFDHYTSNADTLKKWDGPEFQSASFQSIGSTDGRNGTNGCHWSNNSYISKTLPNPQTIIVGFAFNVAVPISTFLGHLCGFMDGSTYQLSVRRDATTSGLKFQRNDATQVLLTSPIPSGQHYIEIKVKIDDTVGTIDVKMDGVSIGSVSGIDTKQTANAYCTSFLIGASGGGQWGVDDLYICDSSGSVNNDFLGDVRAVALFPTGAGNHTDWTPSTGSNYQNVDDTPANGDTDYNSSSTPNQIDTFAMGDLPTGSSTVHGVQYLNYARKDDAGSRSIAPVVRISGTDYVGTTASLGTTYSQQRELHETSPASSSAWTASEVNGLEYGYKEIS